MTEETSSEGREGASAEEERLRLLLDGVRERAPTARRRSEARLGESDEWLRLMIEAIQDYAIFMLDPGGVVLTWNGGAERIKGYRAEDIVGRHFSAFHPEEEVRAGKCQRLLEVAAREGRCEDEGWRVRKDGSRFWADVVITALRDSAGRLVGFAKVTRDLTDRRILEDERVRLAQAKEAVRLRDEFLSIASHELKTPLTALQLQLQSLRDRAEGMDLKMARRVERAARSGERLGHLIEVLLDVSGIVTGQLDLVPQVFDLADAVREVVERLQESAAQVGSDLAFAFDGTLVGSWDRLRIEQMVTNLVSNAIKYGAGAPIRVSLARDEGGAVLEVRDLGPGIPEADLGRIFRRFERAVSVRHHGGFGLGLYVTRQIAEAHGGTVTAGNLPGGGACFTARLPLDAAAAREAPRELH